jgi:hypothetical protein
MMNGLASDLASISEPEAIYIINSGLVPFVKKGARDYLDPFKRGHIVSWSVPSVAKIFEPHGFSVFAIKGKSWAFVIEFMSKTPNLDDLRGRIWTPTPENMRILHDPIMGSVMYVLGLDTARAYSPF